MLCDGEVLYSSNLKTWRRQREQGSLKGLVRKKRGPRTDPDKELLQRIAKLEKENLRLADKLEKAELIIEVQEKVARLLGVEQPEDRDGRKRWKRPGSWRRGCGGVGCV